MVNGAFTASFAFCSTMVYFAAHRRLASCPLGGTTSSGAGSDSGDDPLVVVSEAHATGSAAMGSAGNEQPLIVGRDLGREEGGESLVVRLQRQQGFKQAAFTVLAGAFVGALTTWLLVVNTKDRH